MTLISQCGYLKEIVFNNLELAKTIEIDFGNTLALICVNSINIIDSILKLIKYFKISFDNQFDQIIIDQVCRLDDLYVICSKFTGYYDEYLSYS